MADGQRNPLHLAPAPLPKAFTDAPPLPPGLESDLRAHLAVIQLLHEGRGHASLRLDVAPGCPAKWVIESGGKGQETRVA